MRWPELRMRVHWQLYHHHNLLSLDFFGNHRNNDLQMLCKQPQKIRDFVLYTSYRLAWWQRRASSKLIPAGPSATPQAASLAFPVQLTCHRCVVSPSLTWLCCGRQTGLSLPLLFRPLWFITKIRQREAAITFLPTPMGPRWRVWGRRQVRCNWSRLF